MSGLVLSLTDRQPRHVQSRAIAAVNLQRERERDHVRSIRTTGNPVEVEYRDKPASLDAWYRAQPVKPGRINPRLVLSADEKRLYGLPASARLVDLRGMGDELDHWCVCVFPVLHGYVVGVKAPTGDGGVGVFWRKSYKASDYAMRLSVEYGFPIQERYA
ncbi:hypothetical protein [Sphingomonas sp. PP-CC-3G-468]|uniref:hypothetical protein n=1 Tax=Sphingomonas sp. PP-CC-3G-468 TaxID=2135656 RepID=UPI001044826F|nr:hypothetical protein [Sphingomonas sp. PP-CC-3G-468]TCM10340.1 hypothetical protein C8J41_101855 [Sphingomonas sp. PP-CC-3G-468]